MTNKLTSDEIVEHVRKERYEHKRLKSLTLSLSQKRMQTPLLVLELK